MTSQLRILRPRERLMEHGADYVATDELLAIILNTGTKGVNVLELARAILRDTPIDKLRTSGVDALCAIPGISHVKATKILAALELGKRAWEKESEFPPCIETPEDVLAYVYTLKEARKEHCMAVFLNVKNRVLAHEIISIGLVDSSLIHPREVFSRAIEYNASSVILVHNHPSGDPTPSPEDILITRTMHQAGRILGIEVIDHLVVGSRGYVSISEYAMEQESEWSVV